MIGSTFLFNEIVMKIEEKLNNVSFNINNSTPISYFMDKV